MTKLQSKYCTIYINNLGFIESGQINDRTWDTPSYLVLFRDYTRTDPLCRQWDMTTDMENVSVGDGYIEYTKQVESVELFCQIKVQDKGWDWTIKIANKCPLNHLLGAAIPWTDGNTVNLDKKIVTPVSQYSTSLQQVFNDQTLLLLPILTRESEQHHSIFGTLERDHHFFMYDDSSTPYCRITSSTTKSNSISIFYRVHNDTPSAMYIKLFPESENIICVWKPVFKRIGTKQGVEIIHQYKNDIIERTDEQVIINSSTHIQLKSFSQHLKTALEKYPPNFLKRIGVFGILLSGKIIAKDTKISQAAGMMYGAGESSQRWIFLDVSQNDTGVIHHEIFHYISEHIDMNALPDVLAKDEFYADLFAELMLKPKKEDEMSSALCKEILDFCPDIQFAEQSINSDTQIWALQESNRQQFIFGEMPSNGHYDFVSDIAWYETWNENHPAI